MTHTPPKSLCPGPGVVYSTFYLSGDPVLICSHSVCPSWEVSSLKAGKLPVSRTSVSPNAGCHLALTDAKETHVELMTEKGRQGERERRRERGNEGKENQMKQPPLDRSCQGRHVGPQPYSGQIFQFAVRSQKSRYLSYSIVSKIFFFHIFNNSEICMCPINDCYLRFNGIKDQKFSVLKSQNTVKVKHNTCLDQYVPNRQLCLRSVLTTPSCTPPPSKVLLFYSSQ